ncbi:MAG TPA: M20/M25/M40 family metallo-hydrolase [Chitinophagaceae bacterium]|nr:M20/M25/M40 family metallo-hydrolase [Chitinophagaceae bacterium]
MKYIICCFLFLSVKSLPAQVDVKKIRSYVESQRRQLLKEYADFLAIPNVSGDSANIYRNAYFIRDMLAKRGIKAELLTPAIRGAAPVVFGEMKSPGATRTIAFYAHYDGQPVNEKNWAPGLSPFQPQLLTDRIDKGGKPVPFPSKDGQIDNNWRLYSRSSSDDKAGVFALIAGYEALINSGQQPGINIKFFFEGEEEAGSTNLAAVLADHAKKLAADLWIICDGPMHPTGRKQIVFGVRGDANVELKVYGAKRPLHSGNYGNWAPNPAMMLAQLLSTMKDGNGMVTIEGFYDDVIPLTETEKKAISEIPDLEQQLKGELGIHRPDGNGKPFFELINLPSLNINGIQSANVGAMAANIIPSVAIAELDLRMVLGNDVTRQIEKLKRHIIKQGYHITSDEPTDAERSKYAKIVRLTVVGTSYNAQRTPIDLPIAQAIVKQLQLTSAEKIILLPSLGGSLPLYLFEKYLEAKPITIPVVNYDNNQHAENENIILGFLWEGITSMATLMARYPTMPH